MLSLAKHALRVWWCLLGTGDWTPGLCTELHSQSPTLFFCFFNLSRTLCCPGLDLELLILLPQLPSVLGLWVCTTTPSLGFFV